MWRDVRNLDCEDRSAFFIGFTPIFSDPVVGKGEIISDSKHSPIAKRLVN